MRHAVDRNYPQVTHSDVQEPAYLEETNSDELEPRAPQSGPETPLHSKLHKDGHIYLHPDIKSSREESKIIERQITKARHAIDWDYWQSDAFQCPDSKEWGRLFLQLSQSGVSQLDESWIGVRKWLLRTLSTFTSQNYAWENNARQGRMSPCTSIP